MKCSVIANGRITLSGSSKDLLMGIQLPFELLTPMKRVKIRPKSGIFDNLKPNFTKTWKYTLFTVTLFNIFISFSIFFAGHIPKPQ